MGTTALICSYINGIGDLQFLAKENDLKFTSTAKKIRVA
jgi:hypothetical protein